jgi:hypothetical protein
MFVQVTLYCCSQFIAARTRTLIQIPTLVLGPNRERLKKPIAEKRFSVRIGNESWFRATHVSLWPMRIADRHFLSETQLASECWIGAALTNA